MSDIFKCPALFLFRYFVTQNHFFYYPLLYFSKQFIIFKIITLSKYDKQNINHVLIIGKSIEQLKSFIYKSIYCENLLPVLYFFIIIIGNYYIVEPYIAASMPRAFVVTSYNMSILIILFLKHHVMSLF